MVQLEGGGGLRKMRLDWEVLRWGGPLNFVFIYLLCVCVCVHACSLYAGWCITYVSVCASVHVCVCTCLWAYVPMCAHRDQRDIRHYALPLPALFPWDRVSSCI